MAHEVQEQHLVLAVADDKVKLSVRRFSVREALSQLFSVRIVATSRDPNVDLEALVGQPALFQIAGGQLHAEVGARRWTGVIEHAEQVHVDPDGESTYYLHLRPTLWLLTLRRETRIFQHMKIPAIVKQILDEWGIESLNELNGVYQSHEYVVQYGETDFEFVSRLCEWAGITYYFKFQGKPTDGWEDGTKDAPVREKGRMRRALDFVNPFGRARRAEEDKERADNAARDKARRANDDPHALRTTWTTVSPADDHDHERAAPKAVTAVPLKLALSDGVHQNEARKLPIPFVATQGEAAQEHVTRVRVTHNVAPGRVTVRDFDFRSRLDVGLFGKEAEAAKAPEDFYERYQYQPGAFKAAAAAGGDTPVADQPKAYRHQQQEIGDALAQRRWHAARQDRRVVGFVTNCLDLGPGVVFSIDHHPRADLESDQRLLVRSFSLEGYVNREWTYQGEALYADQPFVPRQTFPKPRIRGVQSAVVVGPPGEEIHVDELGRVKVQMLWDRDGAFDDKSSCWLRVSHGWAGPGYGAMMLPRVGQEVLVGFFEGDPDLPVVVGRVYNAVTNVPYALPEHRTRSTIKTDSSPDGEGFNELMFEDRQGQELIYLQAETDLQKLVKQYETDRVGRDHMTVVGLDRTAVVGKLDATMVGRRYLLRTMETPSFEHDARGKPPKDEWLAILKQDDPEVGPRVQGTAVELKHERVIFTTGRATLAFDGPDIRVEAEGSISIKAGADCVVEGSKVHLNPSAAPPDAPRPEPFELPPHGVFKGHAADPRQELQQQTRRAALAARDLAPPNVPDYVPPPPTEVKQCELSATLLHCMHPTSPRTPCQLQGRPDFHVLEVVPDYPPLPDRPGKGGEGSASFSRALERAAEDDPRPRLDIRGQDSEDGKFVLVNDDVVTLKAQVRDKCDKHVAWTISGKWDARGQSVREDKIGESTFTDVQGWLHHRWRSELELDTNEVVSALENMRTGGVLVQAAEGREVRAPLQVKVKGLSWAARARPRRVDITARACAGAPHKYSVLVYPSDRFAIEFGFGLENLLYWPAFGDWQTGIFDELPVGKLTRVVEANVYIGGSAQWKEHPADHRAFYQYQLALRGAPLLGGKVGFELHLYHVAKWFNPVLGVALWLLDSVLGAALTLEVGGSVSGELTFSRMGPDDLSGTTAGKIGGALTAKVGVDLWVMSKEICGAGGSGATTLTMEATPKTDGSPIDPPSAVVSGKWEPAVVEVYWGIKTRRRARSWKMFPDKSFGPKTVSLVPGNQLQRWLGMDKL